MMMMMMMIIPKFYHKLPAPMKCNDVESNCTPHPFSAFPACPRSLPPTPTVDISSLRNIPSRANSFRPVMAVGQHYDVVNTFLNSPINGNVFCRLPDLL